MKRSPLRRKEPLVRKTSLRTAPPERSSGPLRPSKPPVRSSSQRKRPRPQEPGEAAWKHRRVGVCGVCGERGPVLRHHIVTEQTIRREASAEQIAAGIVWSLANALDVGAPFTCHCHARHHSAVRRIPFSLIPPEAVAFASLLLGAERAIDYFGRYYQQAEGKDV